jgi:hypothetical protein
VTCVFVWFSLLDIKSVLASHIPRKTGWWCSVARRQALVAFNRQVRQLPEDLQRRECALIEIGRKHARDFDAGHPPSGGGAQRVLTELRKLAERMASEAAKTATPVRSALDDIRARRAAMWVRVPPRTSGGAQLVSSILAQKIGYRESD